MSLSDDKKVETLIQLWQETIGVQKHFNDLSLRVRNYLVTLVGAIVAAVAYLYKESIIVQILGFDFNAGAIVLLSGYVILLAIRLMDRHWYHELLIGAVKSGLSLEKELKQYLPDTEFELLTTQIKNDSKDVSIWPFKRYNKETKKWEPSRFDSARRMSIFYILLLASYSILAVSFFVATSVQEKVSKSNEDSVKELKLRYYDTVVDPLTKEEIDLWIKPE